MVPFRFRDLLLAEIFSSDIAAHRRFRDLLFMCHGMLTIQRSSLLHCHIMLSIPRSSPLEDLLFDIAAHHRFMRFSPTGDLLSSDVSTTIGLLRKSPATASATFSVSLHSYQTACRWTPATMSVVFSESPQSCDCVSEDSCDNICCLLQDLLLTEIFSLASRRITMFRDLLLLEIFSVRCLHNLIGCHRSLL